MFLHIWTFCAKTNYKRTHLQEECDRFKKIEIKNKTRPKTSRKSFSDFGWGLVWFSFIQINSKCTLHVFSDWQSTYKRAHNLCELNRSCILQVRKKCVHKGSRLLGSAFNPFTQCVFPLKMRNIFESSAPSGKCWKIRQKWGIKQCLRRKKKKFKKRVKARHPNVGSAKIKDKCNRDCKV